MASRNRFYMYREYKSFTDDMTNEEAGILFKIILDYENGLEIGDVPAEIKGAWSFIKNRLDTSKESYDRQCEANHEAAVRRYETERNSTKSTFCTNRTKRTKRDETSQDYTNCTKRCETASDTDIDTDTDIDIDNKSKGTPTAESLISESGLSESLSAKLLQWITYKRERRENYKPAGLRSLITVVKKHEDEWGTEAVIALIDLCMASNYKGIIWDRVQRTEKPTPQRTQMMTQRAYDFGALERSLIKNA